ncbi:MAG TPA: NUDIX domain-containing protein [Candidatus Eisenbacteria bacterium]|nr:NUDIX domain-containing protein [Candidatus Eisenbacteria bacterium]
MESPNRPDVLVSAFIMETGGRVLLSRHAPYWKWHLPDGDVVRGERLHDALTRAVRHDLGIEVVTEALPFLVTETITKSGAHYIVAHFTARPADVSAALVVAPGIDVRYFSEAELLAEAVLASAREALRHRLRWNV